MIKSDAASNSKKSLHVHELKRVFILLVFGSLFQVASSMHNGHDSPSNEELVVAVGLVSAAVAVAGATAIKNKNKRKHQEPIRNQSDSARASGDIKSMKHCGHCCTSQCNFIRDLENTDLCAASHVIGAVKLALQRVSGTGTLPTALHQFKVSLLQSIISEDLATQRLGLDAATMRILSLSKSSLKFGKSKRGGNSAEMMNEALLAGNDVYRAERYDMYDLRRVYRFFGSHHDKLGDEPLPDRSIYIQPKKKETKEFKGKKKFELGNETIHLFCHPHLRSGSKLRLATEYLNSETHLRFEYYIYYIFKFYFLNR